MGVLGWIGRFHFVRVELGSLADGLKENLVGELVGIAGAFFGAVKHDAYQYGRKGARVKKMKVQTEPVPQYYIISVIGSELDEVARLAPTCNKVEIIILLRLTAEAKRTGKLTVQASARQLATACDAARSNVVKAIDALTKRGIIATRQGQHGQAGSIYLLRFLEVALASGPVLGPLIPASNTRQVVLFQDHPGPVLGPLPTKNQELASDPATVDPEAVITLEGIVDRLSRASLKNRNPEAIKEARGFLFHYLSKLGTEEFLREGKPHPPDDKALAQFLCMGDGAGGWPRLSNLLHDLMNERKRAYNYGWFHIVAAQRIHGIDPKHLKERRAALKLIHQRDRTELAALQGAPAAIAAAKRFR